MNGSRRHDQRYHYSSAKNIMNLIDRIINTPKIKWVIDMSKPFKSYGPEGIIPAMLQQASTAIAPILGEIVKGRLHLSHIRRHSQP